LKLLIESHYLPSIAYFSLLTRFDTLMLEKQEHYVKQTYRNRCYINTTHGVDTLILPLTAKHGKTAICDVKIDYSHKWVNNHWRTLMSAYGNAPFFEFYSDDLHRILHRRFDFLYDFNLELLTLCLKWLRFNINLEETLSYETDYMSDVKDCRSLINPKEGSYLDEWFKPVPYQQVFGNAFVANLSIVDLIFCCGPEAGSIVKASVKSE